ncbi:GIY-YIG nuclease family protein [Burkholderia cepacia]|uniref:GIY-YIG nuclease family protein n=1 Tax=Burkholderia TaxID=32008 RepID=UPI001E2B8F4F|nr:GIY-YIG nuclease family protein [Burkholderia cepacia]
MATSTHAAYSTLTPSPGEQLFMIMCVGSTFCFLLSQDTIVYVGQSKNILGRIATHRSEGEKSFDRIFVIECKPAELDHLEALYIDKFRPVYNAVRPYVSPAACAWDASLAAILGDGCVQKSSNQIPPEL